ncbi:10375_t:CDS:2 [Gigaspora margarita]|uniref:10375_t:CDS:1 n=1 Tax=Gigaspora margarita TaxID=4874 RepID=A0ABN7V9D2_GIGMA|nr:10375_t:CDS:2 [Gigaspora margarita]
MAIAIIYMAKEFNWNHSMQGYVSSSFYIGYISTQIIGGVLTDKFGCRRVLGTGIGEGPTYPAIFSLITKWFPPKERSRAVSVICVSHYISMVIAMPVSNLLGSSQFGWESIFWVFAIVGFIWSVCWHFYGKSEPRDYPGISKEELDLILENESTVCTEDNFGNYQSGSRECITIIDDDHIVPKSENDMLLPKDQISSRTHYVHKIPWKLIFSRREVWAIFLCEFFGAWCFFILFNWLPIFYYEYFNVDIHLIGFYASGYICDYAIHQLKFNVLTVRKSFNIIGTLGLLIPLLLLDIAPKYAGVICGLGNTFAVAPAFFAVAIAGWLLDVTSNNWSIIWCICTLFEVTGTAFYVSWAGGEVIIE